MRQEHSNKKMALGVAIATIAILLITVPAMAGITEDAGNTGEARDMVWVALVGSIIALIFCIFLAINIMRKDEGTDEMKRIAVAVREGADKPRVLEDDGAGDIRVAGRKPCH